MGSCISQKACSQDSAASFTSLSSLEKQLGSPNNQPSWIDLSSIECTVPYLHGILATFYRTHPRTVGLKIQSASTDTSDIPIPESLQTLELTENSLQVIPPKLKCARQLLTLSLAENRIAVLSLDLTSLYSLQHLDLGQNSLTHLNLEVFANLKNLKRINFASNQISGFTGTIPKPWTVLDLSFNQFACLPEEVFQENGQALAKLLLQGNALVTLPASIRYCTALETLDLKDSKLESLPNTVAKLPSLKQLHLPLETIQTPPAEVVELGLRAIKEYFRKQERPVVTTWDELIMDTSTQTSTISLSSVDWQGSYYFDLYTKLETCASLETLQLTQCGLTEMPLYLPTTLVKLDVSWNCIPQLERNLRFAKHLKVLNCSNNRLMELPCVFANTRLEVVDFSFNQISSVTPNAFSKLTRLTDLNLSCNILAQIGFSLPHQQRLQRLNLSYNNLKQIPPLFFEHSLVLKNLLLSGNPLEVLPRSLYNLSSLKVFENYGNSKQPQDLKELLQHASTTRVKAVPTVRVLDLPGLINSKSCQPVKDTERTATSHRDQRPALSSPRLEFYSNASNLPEPFLAVMQCLNDLAISQLSRKLVRKLMEKQAKFTHLEFTLNTLSGFLQSFEEFMAQGPQRNYISECSAHSHYSKSLFQEPLIVGFLEELGFEIHRARKRVETGAVKVVYLLSPIKKNKKHISRALPRIRQQSEAISKVLEVLSKESLRLYISKQ